MLRSHQIAWGKVKAHGGGPTCKGGGFITLNAYDPTKTTINGTVLYNGNPVCAMVSAIGKHLFTSNENGCFNLTNVPYDPNNQIALSAFCSGMKPYKTILTEGKTDFNIELSLNQEESQAIVMIDMLRESSKKPGWFDISGTIKNEANTPLCAMVLANGQYLFTCNPVGAFSLTVPLDSKGEITLYGFCNGLIPYRKVVDESDL